MADGKGRNPNAHRLWHPRVDMLRKAEIPTSGYVPRKA